MPFSRACRDGNLPMTALTFGTFGFMVRPRKLWCEAEKRCILHTFGDLAADKEHSLSESDRASYVAAYSRPGRMRAGWAYFASWPDTAKTLLKWHKPS